MAWRHAFKFVLSYEIMREAKSNKWPGGLSVHNELQRRECRGAGRVSGTRLAQ